MPFPIADIDSGAATPFDVASASFLVGGPFPHSPATISTYIFDVRRWIRLFLLPRGTPQLDKLMCSLVGRRLRAWFPRRLDTRLPFPRSAVHDAANDRSLPLAVRAALAVAWDSLSRLSALFSSSGPHRRGTLLWERVTFTRTHPSPARRGGTTVEIVIFDKKPDKYQHLRVSNDPTSEFFHPGNVSSIALMRSLAKRKTLERHHVWTTSSGHKVTAADLVGAVAAHLPASYPRPTGHCFRISSASNLKFEHAAPDSKIASLGRWGQVQSMRTYLRKHSVL